MSATLSVYMPVPSNFSRQSLISTVFEIWQKSQKLIMFLQVRTGEDLNEMVSCTLAGVTEAGWEPGGLQQGRWCRTRDGEHSFCRKLGIFSFSCLQENIFCVYAWKGIVQGNGCCRTSHRGPFGGRKKDEFPDHALWFWRCSGRPVGLGGLDLSPSAYEAMGHNLVQILLLCFCPFILFLWRRRCLRESIHLTEGL